MSGTGLTIGLGGSARHGCVALSDGAAILGVCEQERATRVRAAGFNGTGLPDEALDLLLGRAGRARSDIARYVVAECDSSPEGASVVHLDRHRAHASAAYFSSPFQSAAIVICDDSLPKVSVWRGTGVDLTPIDWPWRGMGFSDLYVACARLFGFGSEAGEQRFEALARLEPDHKDDRLDNLLGTDDSSLRLAPDWEACLTQWFLTETASAHVARAVHAAAVQRRIGELLLFLLARVREVSGADCLCLGGSLFQHSSINTFVRSAGLFSRVFVPANPGNAGLAVGTALHEARRPPCPLSAFLGPAYTLDEIKSTLDNCKLPYNWVSESGAVELAVDALQRGRLVGWYEGPMEWGPRALGARSILANPFAPFVLENLNRFLKRRDSWRGYALSALGSGVEEHFYGPMEAPFMECDFRPMDEEKFRHVMPSPRAAVRVHTAGQDTPSGFRNLLTAFGAYSGVPCVVNTSFNGFHEPIVCSPRDAIRVFYGSGLDILLLNGFVLSK